MKHLARAFLPVFFLFVVLVPRNAYAFVPNAIGGYGLPPTTIGGAGAAAAGSLGGLDLFAAGALIAVGASISYFAIDYMVGGQNQVMRIPLTLASPVPPPAAPPSQPPTSQYAYYDNVVGQLYSPTHSGLVSAYVAAINAYNGGNQVAEVCPTNPDQIQSVSVYGSPPTVHLVGTCQVFAANPQLTCPTNYTNQSGTCVYTASPRLNPDKACDLSRSGSALAMISDPDCAASGTAIPTICAADGTTCVGWGTAPNGGAPRSYSISPNPDGGTTMQFYQQRNQGGQTVVDTNTVTVDPTGHVTNASSGTQTGSLPQPTGSAATSGTAASVQPVGPSAPTGGGTVVQPSVSITLPTDYARQGEAGTAADKVVTQLSTAPAVDPTLDVEKSQLNSNRDAHKNLLDTLGNKAQDPEGGLLSWTLPQPVTQDNTCADPVIDFGTGTSYSKTITITGYCSSILKVRSILEWILYVITLYLLFNIVTGPRREEA